MCVCDWGLGHQSRAGRVASPVGGPAVETGDEGGGDTSASAEASPKLTAKEQAKLDKAKAKEQAKLDKAEAKAAKQAAKEAEKAAKKAAKEAKKKGK